MKEPSITQYLVAACLHNIDELNEKYGHLDKADLKQVADREFNEMDVTVRLGYPFRQMVHYTVGDTVRKGSKVNHDLYVAARDFKVEIKYLRHFKSNSGNYTIPTDWDEFQKDFDWLAEEIAQGKKHKRAFVMGWFNCEDTIAGSLQLGYPTGDKSLVNMERLPYLPFVRATRMPVRKKELVLNYDIAYEAIPLNLIEENNSNMNCIFIGCETDVFHFAVYF